MERIYGIPLLGFLPERFSESIENNNHSRIIYRNENIERLRLQLHGAIYRHDSFVLMLRYYANLI